MEDSGYQEITLSSLSTSDYPELVGLCGDLELDPQGPVLIARVLPPDVDCPVSQLRDGRHVLSM